jgi:predicted Zn-dependent protease with MMP-like domain
MYVFTDELRTYFDEQLERVLPELPRQVRDFMNDVPLVVEDYPSPEIMRRMRVRHRSSLCGLYTGVPLTQRSINHSGVPSDVIHIYRQGIMSQARRPGGSFDAVELQRQIRFTILHEYGHHVGLTERDLRELGYG